MVFPKRKHPRLKEYDYSQSGYYYVTIQTEKGQPALSTVGRGLAPAGAEVTLTTVGEIARERLLLMEKRYPYIRIIKHVLMPTHIHAIIQLQSETAGASPRPTLMDVVCAYKSLTTRACNHRFNTPGRKLFQTSFYETVLRNEQAFRECWQYIENNPLRWLLEPEES